MTETAASSSQDRPAKKSGNDAKGAKSGKPGFFGRIALFVRQVIGELRKVVTPTRKELIRFTIVVLIFVVIMMALVTVLDLAFGQGIGFIFGGTGSGER